LILVAKKRNAARNTKRKAKQTAKVAQNCDIIFF